MSGTSSSRNSLNTVTTPTLPSMHISSGNVRVVGPHVSVKPGLTLISVYHSLYCIAPYKLILYISNLVQGPYHSLGIQRHK